MPDACSIFPSSLDFPEKVSLTSRLRWDGATRAMLDPTILQKAATTSWLATACQYTSSSPRWKTLTNGQRPTRACTYATTADLRGTARESSTMLTLVFPFASSFGPSANGTFDDSMGDVLGEIQVDLRPLGEMDDDEIQPVRVFGDGGRNFVAIAQTVREPVLHWSLTVSHNHTPNTPRPSSQTRRPSA